MECCKSVLYLHAHDLPDAGNREPGDPKLEMTVKGDDVEYLYSSKMYNHFRRHFTTHEREGLTFLISYKYTYILEGAFLNGYIIEVLK